MSRRTFPDRAMVEAELRKVPAECDRPESPEDDYEIMLYRGPKHPKDKGYADLGTDAQFRGCTVESKFTGIRPPPVRVKNA